MNPEKSGLKKDRQSGESKKRTDNRNEKGPTTESRKGPTNYLPVKVLGVMDGKELAEKLHKAKQSPWTTPKRIAGLLLLTDFILRRASHTIHISKELSLEYVTRLKGIAGIEEQPLTLLVGIGVIQIVRAAKIGPHQKISAEYRISPAYSNRREIEILASRQQREKLANADFRNERRLSRKHPFRARLIVDLGRLSLSTTGKAVAFEMNRADQKTASINQMLEVLDGNKKGPIRIDTTGTIHTFVNGIPRELKPHLEIDGKPVAKCDIEGAHFCILQRIAKDRIAYIKDKTPANLKLRPLEDEVEKLAAMIEAGDIYSQALRSITPEERKVNKRAMLTALNMKTTEALRIPQYQWLRREFPLIFRIIEDIKSKDHRVLSIQLRNYTARVITDTLLALQAKGIAVLPDTDALIIARANATVARDTIERFLRHIAGAGNVSISLA